LLTVDGVVNIKFRKEYFAMYDKQISIIQPDGKKKVMEKSWFERGAKIVIQGIRSGDNFIPKKYASSSSEQLYKITSIDKDGDLVITHQRYQGGIEEDAED
jgi:DNA polymerase-3 subunit alpha